MFYNALQPFMARYSSFRSVLFLFVMSHLILILMMTITFPKIQMDIGQKPFDLQSLGYSLDQAKSIVNALSPKGRRLYIFPQLLLFDVLYPLFLALFLSTLSYRLSKLMNNSRHVLPILIFLPFIAALFDYFENVMILGMITDSIQVTNLTVALSSWATRLKGGTTVLSWLAIAVLFVRYLNNRRKLQRKTNL